MNNLYDLFFSPLVYTAPLFLICEHIPHQSRPPKAVKYLSTSALIGPSIVAKTLDNKTYHEKPQTFLFGLAEMPPQLSKESLAGLSLRSPVIMMFCVQSEVSTVQLNTMSGFPDSCGQSWTSYF